MRRRRTGPMAPCACTMLLLLLLALVLLPERCWWHSTAHQGVSLRGTVTSQPGLPPRPLAHPCEFLEYYLQG